MRNQPALTVFFSLWKSTRAMSIIIALGLAAAYLCLWFADRQGLRPGAGEPSEDLIVALLLIALPAIVMAASVVLANSDADQLSIALPTRILRLPLATWKITAILLVFGASAVTLATLAGTVPALFLLNVDFDWWLPVLTAASIVPLVQLWAFAFGNASPRVALVSFITGFGGMSAIARQPFFVQLATQASPVLNLLLFALFLGVVFFIAWAVVRIQRRGGWLATIPRRATQPAAVRPLRPFRSSRRAQFWYEWRQYGPLLPIYVTGTALVYFIGLPLIVAVFRISDVTGESSSGPLFVIDWFGNAQFITTGLGLAGLIGGLMVGAVLFMRGGHWNSQSNYLLTRPLSLARISNARLAVMLTSGAASLLCLLFFAGAIEGFAHLRGGTTGLGFFLHQGYEQVPRWVAVAAFFAGLALLVWTCSWSTSYVYVLGVALVLIALPLAMNWAAALFGLQDVAAAKERMTQWLPILEWVTAVTVVFGYLVLAWMADTQRLLHWATPWVSAALWLVYSAAFVYYVNKWDAPVTANEWYVRFPHPVVWPLWIAASIVPIAPAVLHPFLLERVRHR